MITIQPLAMRIAEAAPGAPSVPVSFFEDYLDYSEDSAKKWTQPITDSAEKEGSEGRQRIVRTMGSVVAAITEGAQVKALDFVIGTRGLGGFKRLVLDSVSSGVVAHEHCPVLVAG